MTAAFAVREVPEHYATEARPPDALDEARLTAAWLLGRVPAAALPWPLLRAGRAGRGPGPDVREALLLLPSGVTRSGDVEVHRRASDFWHHGHADDPAYAGLVLHLVWDDDRPPAKRGPPTPLPGGGSAPTVALAPLIGNAARLRALVALGPAGAEPCAAAPARLGADAVTDRVRAEGRRRLAERTWRAWRLADQYGWEQAWALLLERALAGSAGRRRDDPATLAARVAAITTGLGGEPLTALGTLALAGRPALLIEVMQVRAPAPLACAPLGRARAAEVAWNAALPLLAAAAAAWDDIALARATARLAEAWPAPAPYGKTRALAALVGGSSEGAPTARRGGALHPQGLLHLQDLWCTRGGCGACPLSIDGA